MRVLSLRRKSRLPIWAPALFLCFGVQSLFCRPAGWQQSSSFEGGGVQDVEQSLGPFALGGQNYAVVLHEKRLADARELRGETLAAVEIRDVAGNVSYRKDFPYSVEQGHFRQSLSASAESVSGKTGKGLILHYREQTGASQTNKGQSREFWQLFGLMDGKLAPLGSPAPIGVPAPGAPFMGVMMRAANGTVSVISQPDTIEVRAWTGFFYAFIPLRVNWNHGGLEQGQRCMEMIGGGLQEVGCDMRVAAIRKPPAGEFSFVRLFAEAHENMGVPDHVVIQKDSKVEILGSSAIIVWNKNGELIQPLFSDLWLHVGIDNRTGWIHGEEDFAAVGLPAGNPTP
jgi:hypothetical protein